jgi:hypothetical protein
MMPVHIALQNDDYYGACRDEVPHIIPLRVCVLFPPSFPLEIGTGRNIQAGELRLHAIS